MTLSAVPGFARAFALPFAFLATSAFASGGTITLTDSNTSASPLHYTGGPYFVPTSQLGCDPTLSPCDDTTLTINVSPETAAGKRVVVDASWATVTLADFDLFVMKGAGNTDTSKAFAASASTTDPEVARFLPINGTYTIHVEPYQPFYNSIDVKVYLEDLPTITPATSGPAARFQVYAPPAALESDASGGEPSIGSNTKTGSTVIGNSSTALFVTWNDGSSPAVDSWASRSPFTNLVSFDPILFTDRETGLTVASQLVSDVVTFSAGCSLSSVTYDDGVTWIPAEGCGPPAGADHQAVGGGPYHAITTPAGISVPFPTLPAAPGAPVGIAQHAVYYCAQSVSGVIGDATCSRSDDGGLTYGPGVVVYTSECGGIHGHPRVSPEGTVYLPNRDCAGTVGLGQGVVISKDNGLTWGFSIIPGSTVGDSDPSIATGLNNTGKPTGQAHNTVYFAYCDGDGHPKVSISRNEGTDFSPGVDVGTPANIKNCVFPEMIAGDDNRASFFFLGTQQGGGYQAADFTGEWHAYVATTYDGGASWGLYDATPTDPVQMGCIWMQGGSSPCRNLLDFNDISLDKEGRPNFVFADGCLPKYDCRSGSNPSKSHKAVETIGRQSGGKTLLSAYDAQMGNRIIPAAPKLLTATSGNDGVALTWATPDDGGSPITAYRIFRGTAAGGETFLKAIAGNKPEFTDATTHTGTTYFYKVSAVNANGEGAKYGELSAAGHDVPNTAPTVTLTPASASINAGQAVDFTLTAADADATDHLSYDLDFGDGTPHALSNAPSDTNHPGAVTVSHTYASAGSFTAKATVTDSHDATAQATSAIAVAPVQTGGDTTPDAFTFVVRSNVVTSAFVTSETKALAGFDTAVPVTVSSNNSSQYSLNGGAWTSAAGTAHPGDTIAVRHVSASTASTQVDTTVTVGGTTATFTSVTSAADRTPDAFTFGTKTGVDGGVLVESDPITLTGYNTGIALVAGPGLEYSVAGGAWTSASGTLQVGQAVKVGSSRVDLQACKLEYSIVSPK